MINSSEVSFVGAWTLFGFHEDGFTSGIRIAEKLGAKVPFEIVDARDIRGKERRGMAEGWGRREEFGRMVLIGIQWVIIAFLSLLRGKSKID